MLKVVGYEGGPCGGKTSAIEYTVTAAQHKGVQTIVVPEVATEMIRALHNQGKSYQDIAANNVELVKFQAELLYTIAASIKRIKKQRTVGANTLVLVDRVDNAAYLSESNYAQVLDAIGYDEPPMYTLVDTVLYFPTIARHDPAKYTSLMEQNSARYETPEAAVHTCNANRKAVQNHPDVWYMNEKDFNKKLHYAANIALMGCSGADSLKLVNA